MVFNYQSLAHLIKFMFKKVLFSCSFVFLILTFLVWYFVLGIHIGDVEGLNKHKNAIWIKHSWVTSYNPHSIKELVKSLTVHDVKYVFVHVGPIEEDGGISEDRYYRAKDFLNYASKLNPDLVWMAWMGQIRSKIDLDNPAIRQNIILKASEMIEIGFNGVHIDIEPVGEDDLAFIKLLEQLHQNFSSEKVISVALEELLPRPILMFLPFSAKNSKAFFLNVAKYSDQIVIMTYDTKIQNPWFYSWFVEQQVIFLTQILEENELLFGIPTYSYDTPEDRKLHPHFYPEAENMKTGLSGIISGLRNIRSNPLSFTGVAIYANWETDTQEWEIYDKLWK